MIMRNVWRVGHLVASCIVLGIGVAMLLLAALGSDGYSTLVNGGSIALGVPFLLINCVLGLMLLGLAWWRGVVPGIGTVVQPVVVGATVSAVLASVDAPDSNGLRSVLLALAFPVLVVGVAGYLSSGTGAGPSEAAALAFDPPVPFRWSYSVLQGGGALIGWLLGAAIGPGTLLVIFLLGPCVDLLSTRVRIFDISAAGRSATSPR
jgi:uncharacterized membrane protein YczE